MLSVNSILKPVVNGGHKAIYYIQTLAISGDILFSACVHFDLEIHAQQKHLLSQTEISR